MPTTEQRDVPRPLMPFLYFMEHPLFSSGSTSELLMNRGIQGIYGGCVYTPPGGVCAHTPNFFCREIPTKKRVLSYTPNWRRGCHVYGKKFRLFMTISGVSTPLLKDVNRFVAPSLARGVHSHRRSNYLLNHLKCNLQKIFANLRLKIKYPDLKTVMPVSKSGLLCVDEVSIENNTLADENGHCVHAFSVIFRN